MKLRQLAHSRSGDKGNISNISVIAFDPQHYAHICEHVTAARVRSHFGDLISGTVTRYELEGIGALNFVLTGALGGGVLRSLALDSHGKALSSALLDLDVPEPSPPFYQDDWIYDADHKLWLFH